MLNMDTEMAKNQFKFAMLLYRSIWPNFIDKYYTSELNVGRFLEPLINSALNSSTTLNSIRHVGNCAEPGMDSLVAMSFRRRSSQLIICRWHLSAAKNWDQSQAEETNKPRNRPSPEYDAWNWYCTEFPLYVCWYTKEAWCWGRVSAVLGGKNNREILLRWAEMMNILFHYSFAQSRSVVRCSKHPPKVHKYRLLT